MKILSKNIYTYCDYDVYLYVRFQLLILLWERDDWRWRISKDFPRATHEILSGNHQIFLQRHFLYPSDSLMKNTFAKKNTSILFLLRRDWIESLISLYLIKLFKISKFFLCITKTHDYIFRWTIFSLCCFSHKDPVSKGVHLNRVEKLFKK